MDRFFCDQITDTQATLNEQETLHCIKALRHQVGEIIEVFDGQGTVATAKIVSFTKKSVALEIVDRQLIPKPSYYLHVVMAPTKQNDRMEWFIEKAVEYGIDELSFIKCTNNERVKVNIERCNKIALAAAKQSWAAYLPKIHNIQAFHVALHAKEDYDLAQIATLHEKSINLPIDQMSNKSVICFIGPEGGFTLDEIHEAIANGIQPVRLGSKRLRSESAALLYPSILYAMHL